MGGSSSKEDKTDSITVNTQNNVSISEEIKNHYELFSLAGIVILIILALFLYLRHHRHRRKRSLHLNYDL